jgi:hypothetical protein
MTKGAKRADPEQSRRFIKAARELGTDNDPERFKAIVRKVASAPPAPKEPGKAKPKSPAR